MVASKFGRCDAIKAKAAAIKQAQANQSP